jgi:hypothetical protein
MNTVGHSQSLQEEDICELAKFFDLLAKYDFEDVKASRVLQEVDKYSSVTNGEYLSVSCEHEEQIR